MIPGTCDTATTWNIVPAAKVGGLEYGISDKVTVDVAY